MGESQAKALYGVTQSAMKLIRKRMVGVEGDLLDPNMGILNVSWFNEAEKVRSHAERMNEVFGENFEFWPREKVREYYTTARYYDAYFKPSGLIANVLQYTDHVAKLSSNRGAGVYEKSPVIKVKKRNDLWHVETRKGTVIADQVVYCCSAYIGFKATMTKMGLAIAYLPPAETRDFLASESARNEKNIKALKKKCRSSRAPTEYLVNDP